MRIGPFAFACIFPSIVIGGTATEAYARVICEVRGQSIYHCPDGYVCDMQQRLCRKGRELKQQEDEANVRERALQKRLLDAERARLRAAREEQRHKSVPRRTYFDCSHRSAAGGAAWDAECLRPTSKRQPYAPDVALEALSRRAADYCRAHNNTSDCMREALARAIASEEPASRDECAQVPAVGIVECLTSSFRRRALSAELKRRLGKPATLPEDEAKPGPKPPNEPQAAPDPSPKEQVATRPDTSVYCLFIAHRINESDLAYSRAEQIPDECRSADEVKMALAELARRKPVIHFDSADREYNREQIEYLRRLWKKDPALDNALPGTVTP